MDNSILDHVKEAILAELRETTNEKGEKSVLPTLETSMTWRIILQS